MSNDLDLSSKEKAAILIRLFDDETAKKIISYLTPEEKEKIVQEIAIYKDYEFDVIETVAKDYLVHFGGKQIGNLKSGIEYLKDLFKDIPEKELEKMIGKAFYDVENPLDFLSRVKDVQPLITFLENEDPQTIAIVCNYLEDKQAADLIDSLPEEKMIETVIGVAKLDQMDGELLAQIGSYLSKKLDSLSTGEDNKADGMKKIVSVLNNVPRSTEKVVFERLDVIDSYLADAIKEQMFTFDDLVKLDNLTLQKILGEVQINTLAKAMKIAKEELKEKLFQCMSTGRQDMLTQELEGMGPLKMTDAEKAQTEVANVVKKLEKDGKIQIARGQEDVIF